MRIFLTALMLMLAPLQAQAVSAPEGVAEDAPIDPVTGIRLAPGFKASVFADGMGRARHMAVADTGWLYVALMKAEGGFGAVAFRDSTGDGHADLVEPFAPGLEGTGMGIDAGYLYYATDEALMRWPLPTAGAPKGDAEIVVDGFPNERQHSSKPFSFDGNGHVYVTIGAPSNACMEKMRTKGSPGMDPCPILDNFGGIWRFDQAKLGQKQTDGVRYATGIRNAMANDWNPHAGALYIAQHGRDQLASFFPELFSDAQSAELPAEEFHRVDEGADLGWPYSYFDPVAGARMVMPEYGGDGKAVSSRGQMPLIGFPAHWAPNDLMFLRQTSLPEAWQQGAFIAFHGSWNRAPFPQQGYRVVYVPMNAKGEVSGDWITFADGFAGDAPVMNPRAAKHRPTGLAEGADGAIYISSLMSGGRIWKVTYEGN